MRLGLAHRGFRGSRAQGEGAAPPPRRALSDANDEVLLGRARAAKNGTKFRALFDEGDTSAYGSQSEADLALCMILAFWTNRDAGRMDRLFRRSALFRPKWDQSSGGGETYGERTVRTAVNRSASDRPSVVFSGVGGDVPLHQILPQAVEALASRCGESICRGEVLSRVIQTQETAGDKIQRSGAPRILKLPDSILRERLDEAVRWIRKRKSKSGDVVRREEWCPRPIVEAIRDRATWPGIRPLLGVVTAPTLRIDGSVLDRPGYDEATGLIYQPTCAYRPCPSARLRPRWPRPIARSWRRSGSSRCPRQRTRLRSRP